jgi:hypothetical protein
MLKALCLFLARVLPPSSEPRYGKEILNKRVKIQTSDGKRWRNATVTGYHGGYLRHTGKCLP